MEPLRKFLSGEADNWEPSKYNLRMTKKGVVEG